MKNSKNDKLQVMFSIIIPTYNSSQGLIHTLKSIEKQTYFDYEIIIVDDGSTDDTRSVVTEYSRGKDNIIYIYQANAKQGAARNKGLTYAKGMYVLFIDAGDNWSSTILSELDEKLNDENNLDVCFFGYEHIDIENKRLYSYVPNENYNLFVDKNMFEKYEVPMSPCFHVSKRQFLLDNKIEFLENVFFEDIDYIIKVVSFARKGSSINCIGYSYLIEENSTVRGGDAFRNLDVIASIESLKNIYTDYFPERIDIVEFIAIKYLYIDAVIRVFNSTSTKSDKMKVIDNINKYMNTTFEGFENNAYISKLPKTKKLIYELIRKQFFGIIQWIVKIRFRNN